MNFDQLINNITPDIITGFRRAIEIGKWPGGEKLTQQQKELAMEAVITYENRFVDETARVGYIDRGIKAEGELCDDTADLSVQAKPLKWT